MKTAAEIIEIITRQFGDALAASEPEGLHPHILVKPERLREIGKFLKNDTDLAFDLLRCISAVDWPAKNTIEISYDLISTRFGHVFAVKVSLDRTAPKVESVSGVWPAANWHEREAYDLMGVTFTNHPDPRRILMPDDWAGHPLRKDYQDPVEYHGLKIKE
jgi:NADH-quinone oxidoreductase subunit C